MRYSTKGFTAGLDCHQKISASSVSSLKERLDLIRFRTHIDIAQVDQTDVRIRVALGPIHFDRRPDSHLTRRTQDMLGKCMNVEQFGIRGEELPE
jgi:hypothetical protein